MCKRGYKDYTPVVEVLDIIEMTDQHWKAVIYHSVVPFKHCGSIILKESLERR